MELTGYRWANSEHTEIVAVNVDGAEVVFKARPGFVHYDDMIANNVNPQNWQPTVDDYSRSIEAHVDNVAKSRGYASGERMASYATDPAFAFEAQPFVIWRGQVWIYANTELAKVQAGQRAAPTVEGFIAELPAITWP